MEESEEVPLCFRARPASPLPQPPTKPPEKPLEPMTKVHVEHMDCVLVRTAEVFGFIALRRSDRAGDHRGVG
jgi:hypothetical protein